MSDEQDSWPLLTSLTRGVVASDPGLAARMAEHIRAELPFYRAGGVPLAEIEESTHTHVAVLTASTMPPHERDAASRGLGEKRARDGVDLTDVTDALRSGTKFLWDETVASARRQGSVSDTELVDLASQMWLMHERFAQATIAGYRQEFARSLLSRQQERLGLLYGLLTTRGSETASPWNAVDRLGLPRVGGYVVVAVAAPTTGRMPLPRIEPTLADAQVTSAWVMAGGVQLGVVSTALANWAEELRNGARPWTATAGVSPRQHDYGRIGLAVRLARTALAAASPNTFSFFDESPISMSAAGSPEISEPIMLATFGALLRVDQPERSTLIETLAAWLDEGSFAAVAARLQVHQNTVRNRMRRVHVLTGRDASQPRQAAELCLALAAYRQAGASVTYLDNQ